MGIYTLKNTFNSKGRDYIKDLLKSYMIISEKIEGSRFLFHKTLDDKFIFYKKSNKEISIIDRVLMKFYEKAISYILNLETDVKNKIPDNWTFGFQYIPTLEPINIKYENQPKNNLILTDISIRNESGNVIKVIHDADILYKWSNILNVENPPILYKGKLNSDQYNKILDFIETSDDDLKELFNDKSFTRFIINIINPNVRKTILSNSLDSDIDGLIFKFIINRNDIKIFKIIDPIDHYSLKEIKKDRKPNHMYQISMLDIVEFIEQLDLNKIPLESDNEEERYIELISIIFNKYVRENGHKYAGVNFSVPDFAKNNNFKLNTDLIKDSTTKEIVKNQHMSNLYKIILSSFRKHRKHSTDILTETIISSINDIVDKISDKIKIKDNDDSEIALDFETFLNKNKVNENINSIFENEIFEGLTLNTTKQGNKPVNIIVGRFQPFTKGHAKVFENLHKENGLPVVIFTVRGKKPNPEKNPFPEEVQLSMFAAMQRQFKFLEAMYTINSAAIDKIFNELRPAYEPVLWGTGTDRLKGYNSQIERYRDELNCLDEFKAIETKRTDKNISATKVRLAIEIGDEKTFKKFTPKSIHKYYDNLQDILNRLMIKDDNNINIESNLSLLNSIHEKIMHVGLNDKPQGEVLGLIDKTADDYNNIIRSIKVTLMSSSIDPAIDKRCEDGNIFEENLKDNIKDILKRGWVGDIDNIQKFIDEKPIEIAKLDKNKYDLNQIINHYGNYFNSNVLIRLLNESGRIGGINVGKGEYFLALLTDYSRPPKGKSGDLWFNGSVEVKDNQARLGGTDIKRDGTQSIKEFYEIIGLDYQDDSYTIRTIKNRIIPFIQENEQRIFKDKKLIKKAINSLSNYDLDIDNNMVDILKKIYKNPSDFETYLGAIQMHAYNAHHNHSEIIFIDTNKLLLSSYHVTNSFKDSWNFAINNLKFSASSWHGRHAPNKTGLSVKLQK